MIANYTSATSVRALLGVSIKELPDATILDTFFWLSLQAELYRVCETIASDYSAAIELADTDNDAGRFSGAVGLFATYAVARSCMTAMPQFAARSVTDGKAGFIRHTSTSFDAAIARFDVEYARARAALVTAYGSYLPDATLIPESTREFFQVSSPAFDPVTGA